MQGVRFQIGLTFCCCLLLISCQEKEQDADFFSWYKQQPFAQNHASVAPNKVHEFQILSGSMQLDTIYRSMKGPFDIRTFQIDADEQLVWLVGYEVELLNSETSEVLPAAYMCHNNLNLADKSESPWKVKTGGTKTRLFTLAQGATSVRFPDGFGIPLEPGQQLETVSQVLNHNIPEIDLEVQHRIKLYYIKESERVGKMTPLYQQTLFVTKQTGGPAGEYGTPPIVNQGESNRVLADSAIAQCGIRYDNEQFNPGLDQYGRRFTGHWNVEPGSEALATDVSRTLNLSVPSNVHYMAVHLHPFAEHMQLRDVTADTVLFQVTASNFKDRIGLHELDFYSSEQGLALFPDHQYVLESEYANPTQEVHTAMATLSLYLAETAD